MGFSKAADGFYTATPTAGWQDGYRNGPPATNVTMIIFVSNVSGSDNTSATEGSKANPYRTLTKAFSRTGGTGSTRAGSPDQILLATGETWTDEFAVNGGIQYFGPGMNEQNRMVLSSYDKTANISAPNNPPVPNPTTGVVARPIVKPALSQWSTGIGFNYANTAIIGIDFYMYMRDTVANPANANNWNLGQTGIVIQNDTRPGNILIEDNIVRWFQNGIMADSINSIPESGPISVRRNVIHNNWGDKYGIGSWKVTPGFLVEENFIDQCGWDPVGQPGGSGLNHNLYLSGNNQLHPYDGGTYYDGVAVSDLYYRGNINTNSLMQENNRCGGHYNNNLWQLGGHGGTNFGPNNPAIANLIENEVAIGGFLGGSTHADAAQNAFELKASFGPDGQLGYYALGVPGIQHVNINNCIITQGFGNATAGIDVGSNGAWANLVTVSNCITYKFSGTVVYFAGEPVIDGGGNHGTNSPTQATAFGWAHPERTPETYMAEVIHDGSTWADFIRRCRLQSRRNWNPLLMAELVNDYIREGFGKAFIGSAYAGGFVPTIITISPASLPGGTIGVAYPSQTFSATGGVSPYTFAVVSGALPNGLTLTSGGLLSGTPTTAGTFNFTVRATDSLATTADASYSVTVILNFHRVSLTMTAA